MINLNPFDRDFLIQESRESLLPQPVQEEIQFDGAIVIIGGDPGEVIVKITDKKVSVAMYAVQWHGPLNPIVIPRWLGSLSWHRLPSSQMFTILVSLITMAKDMRKSKYRKCNLCKMEKPPEWMHDETTCQSCTERDLGVVY